MARQGIEHLGDRSLLVLSGAATFLGVAALLALLGKALLDGAGHLSVDFFTQYASRFPERAGIKAALFGSVWVVGLALVIAIPLAVGAAIYLEEYAPPIWITRIIRSNLSSLAGVPSIVYGILGLVLFVRMMGLGRSVLAGALTLAIMVIPMITLAAAEAIRSVPRAFRTAAFGLGASRWQVVRHQVLPGAFPGILSGAILALSRALGETAPLIMIGFLTFVAFTPESPGDPFTVLPLQIFGWISRGEEFWGLAAAAIVVLLALVLGLNALAVFLRSRLERGE
jgi:phosphate transport system permease protein